MIETRSQNKACPEELIPTRSSLLGRLKDWEDQDSWSVFFETYWRLIYNFAMHRGLTHEEAQEVVQETVVAVAKSIGTFRYDREACSFKTWLLRITCSKIANQFARRARHPNPPASAVNTETQGSERYTCAADEQTSPWEQEWDEEWRRNLMEAAMRRVKEKVSIEHYQMFDLLVNKQWDPGEVARLLKVTVGLVYVAKHRVSKVIRKEIETLEKQGF